MDSTQLGPDCVYRRMDNMTHGTAAVQQHCHLRLSWPHCDERVFLSFMLAVHPPRFMLAWQMPCGDSAAGRWCCRMHFDAFSGNA